MAGKLRWLLWMAAILVMVYGPSSMAAGEGNSMNAYQSYLKTGEAPSLYKKYEGLFKIGAAVSPMWLKSDAAVSVITRNFNSLTCENEMKADFVMDHKKTVAAGDKTRVALNFQRADTALSFARENGMTMRAHTLVWHSQVPRWFFSANYEKGENSPLASRDVMEKRMENYIHDVMDYVNTQYPGVVYAWDVVNEAIEPGDRHPNGLRTANNLWYQAIGDDFVELAFTYARKYAAPEQKLFYNDYNCYQKNKLYLIRSLLKSLSDKGLVDGLGMQGHIGMDTSLTDFEEAITLYSSLPIELQVTELDIKTEDNSLLGQMALASKYRRLFSMLARLKERAGINITSVTFWGITDDRSWLNNREHSYYPLLFNADLTLKAAFFGVLQDDSIPMQNTKESLQKAVDALGLAKTAAPPSVAGSSLKTGAKKGYKGAGENNPVMTQRFGADPYALVYDGRVYLYMTGDVLEYNFDGTVKNNTYSKINTINVVSSADLVNWTDHGAIRAAGNSGAASWAANSWAPAAAIKEIDGRMKFFLYFANSAGGIGVLTGDSPTGPFSDPIGKPIISRQTPNCAGITWLFDPAVLTDDDGRAYLYFGGGVPQGKAAAPQTARAVMLGEDMTSIAYDPVMIDAPYLFEDSGINKIGGTYCYSYCTNFQVPMEKEMELGLANGQIHYMTSKSPLGPFAYAGLILKNPGDFFGCWGNNHHCLFSFEGKWYIAYHTQTLETAMGLSGGYRCTFIDALNVDDAGIIAPVAATRSGVTQLKPLNPFERVEAETIAAMAGVSTGLAPDADGKAGTGNGIVTAADAGGYISVRGVDFGDEGAGRLMMHAKNEKSVTVQIRLDHLDSDAVYTALLTPSFAFSSQVYPLNLNIQGIHDVYFVFESAGVELDWWKFLKSGT